MRQGQFLIRVLVCVFTASFVCIGLLYAQTEELTITTFYPSPYGSYQIVHFVPTDSIDPTAACTNEGEVYCDASSDQLYLCINNQWVEIAGEDGTTLWYKDGNRIHNRDGRQVYIDSRLDVAGHIEARTVHANGSDIAELFPVEKGVEVADVVSVDPQSVLKLVKADIPYDSRVIGIISGEPGMILGKDKKENHRAIALQGRVPCKVTTVNGKIEVGDLLTTSTKPGYAMKLILLDYTKAKDFKDMQVMMQENERRRSSVIGKALESLSEGEGKILVFLTR